MVFVEDSTLIEVPEDIGIFKYIVSGPGLIQESCIAIVYVSADIPLK